MRYNARLARVCDAGVALVGPAIAWLAWELRDIFPLWGLALVLLLGLFLGFVGLAAIRTGASSFALITATFVDPPSMTRQRATQTAWMAWLHTRLPDPERQKALREALDKAYPRPRMRTIFGVIVLGGGGWLVVTSLGAIIEWFIQGGLDQLFPQLFR